MKTSRQNNFTLVEVIVTMSISSMILVVLMSIYIFPYRSWKSGTTYSILDQEMQFAREKLLRNLTEANGLRSANYSSIQITDNSSGTDLDKVVFQIDNNTTPGVGTNYINCTIYVENNTLKADILKAGSSTTVTLTEHSKITKFNIEKKLNKTIAIAITLKPKNSSKTTMLTKTFTPYICND